MTDDEINDLIIEHHATSGEINDVISFARAIESRTLTNQKAKWYQEGVEAGLRQALDQLPDTTKMIEPNLLNQVCCECGNSGGYALYCGDCWSKAETRYTQVGQVVQAFGDLTAVEIPNMPPVGTKLYIKEST